VTGWRRDAKRDHFDFVTKMRDRGVEVVEIHNLLAGPEGRSRSRKARSDPDNQVVPTRLSLVLPRRVRRSYLEGSTTASSQKTLIGGSSRKKRTSSRRRVGGKALQVVTGSGPAITEYLLASCEHAVHSAHHLLDLRWCHPNPLYWPARHEETILTKAIYKFHPDFAGNRSTVWWRLIRTEDHRPRRRCAKAGDVDAPSARATC